MHPRLRSALPRHLPGRSLRSIMSGALALAALLLNGTFAGSAAQAAARTPARPDLRSAAALVFDETHATVLYARRADVPLPIASITKLMTALVVLEAGQGLDDPITITGEDRNLGKGAVSRLSIGATLTRGDLMHVALMSSENRAAHALGRNYPGGLSAAVAAMNAKARALGMTRTRFVDPAGLSSRNVASPSDLAKLVVYAARNPDIRHYSTDAEHTVRVGRQVLEFRNTNNLVKNPGWDITVQKTGYLVEAGRCLVMRAAIEGREVVIVLLNSYGKYTRVADARRIRKWMEATLKQRAAHITPDDDATRAIDIARSDRSTIT
jgi:serine-type D-Ala-D-Ala endopeptidase (penicillin-binding protein 7)